MVSDIKTSTDSLPSRAQSRLQLWRATAPVGLSIALSVSDASIRFMGMVDMSGANSWAEIDVVDALALGSRAEDTFDQMLGKLTADLLEGAAQ